MNLLVSIILFKSIKDCQHNTTMKYLTYLKKTSYYVLSTGVWIGTHLQPSR
jgi:hypothetical protein